MTQELSPNDATLFDSFARFYDDDYRLYQDDLQLLTALAEEFGGPILELGCGTGRVLLPLASAGHTVHGIDFSPALLALAEQKVAQAGLHEKITLFQADMTEFELPQADYAFAFCVSNTLMHCSTQKAQIQVLENVHRHLSTDGLLLIDLFNPDIHGLTNLAGFSEYADSWTNHAGNQVIKWSVRSIDVANQLQDTLFIYEEIDEKGASFKTLCPFTLRFLWPSEAKLMLEKAGFELVALWGSLDYEEYNSSSDRIVILARKP